MKDLTRKVAAITGAASGIGRALALELATQGAELALSDLDEDGLARTAEAAAERGAKVTRARVDVADRAAMHGWADQVVADHGRANLIFNNAGVTVGATVEDITWDDFDWLMGINFWGVIHGTKAFLPHLIASGDGHVINISSIFGIIGVPGQSAYNAAKFAVRGFTESLRQELAIDERPVSATSVHPGGIKTRIARNARLYPKEGGPTVEEAHAQFDRLARTTPERAARSILAGVKRNARRVLIGVDARVIDAVQRIFPTGYQIPLTAIARRGTTLV